ncbi:AbfB domain-containing protein [Paractinoplanes durhamensis]|uniref:AbfB domain-containing protein n=1 Tax=Paractinoplanes durhamensis TaxID=113563 RepID=UPI00362C0687
MVIATQTQPVAEHTTKRPSATPSRTTTTKPTPAVTLTVGSTVGLEISGSPGVRLRHRNFIARADRMGSADSPLEKADAAFTVRDGLADDGCVSLESVNYPGYFLRHRDFVLRLEQGNRQNAELFRKDATFCATPTTGGAVILESINYPTRAVHLRGDGIFHLDEGTGTALVVRRPL